MNFLPYKFSDKVQEDLLKFLRIANEQKTSNNNCDLREYEVWKKVFPLDESLKKKLKDKAEAINEISIIDEDGMDGETMAKNNEEIDDFLHSKAKEESKDLSLNDLAFALKENLESRGTVDNYIENKIREYSETDLKELFTILLKNVNSDEICTLGRCLQALTNDALFSTYLRYLLLPKCNEEFCDNIMDLLNEFSKYSEDTLKTEFLNIISKMGKTGNNLFLQYFGRLSHEFQSSLLRDFVFTSELQEENSLEVVETLLNAEVDCDVLNKLIQLLSNISIKYAQDKNFGKLIVKIIDYLGTNILHLERPLKHIITNHKSIWKLKLQKTFDNHFNESMLFTQSFRY